MTLLHIRQGVIREGLNPDRVLVLGLTLLFFATSGFYMMEGLIQPEAEGSRLVNSFYCAVMTLTTVGFGDICPGPEESVSTEARLFLVGITLLGLGIFCGPVMNLASWWRHYVSPSVLAVMALSLGTAIFMAVEDRSLADALYASVITATTIGYGDITPSTEYGKVLVAFYSLFVVNVMGILLEPARVFFEDLCRLGDTISSKEETTTQEPKKDL